MYVRVGLVTEVRVSNGKGWSIGAGQNARETDTLLKAVVASGSVAVGACVGGWVFSARVTLVHVVLALNAYQSIETVEASWEVAVGAGSNMGGDGTNVAAGGLWVT